jgi:hypothetical protein
MKYKILLQCAPPSPTMEEAVVVATAAVATERALIMVAAILVGLSAMASRLRKRRSLHRTIRMEVTTGTEEHIRREIIIGKTIHTTAITTTVTATIPMRKLYRLKRRLLGRPL